MKGERRSAAAASASATEANARVPVALITLGCPRNLVDSETMLGDLHRAGFRITGDPSEAALVVVNTCGFLTSSQQESIEAILEAARWKQDGSLRGLVVTGCLPERHGDAVLQEIPEIDYLLGPGTFHALPEVARGLLSGELTRGARLGELDRLVPEWEPRALSNPGRSAYLKVGEGCRHSCSFCIIPRLRGRLRSRPLEELEAEARRLAEGGVREITLVAQDTTAYGQDLYGEFSLPRLLERLEKVDGIRWIRLLYTDPRSWTEELLDCFGRLTRLVPYVDLPVQHVADRLLRSMRRGLGWRRTESLLRRLRDAHPEMVLRTTVITGYPGETPDEFQRLLATLRDFEFDHLGAFAYSTEEGTPAAALPGQIPEDERAARRDVVLGQQRGIALRRNRARIGQRIEVLVEAIDEERGLARGRWWGQAPEIDGEVLLPRGCRTTDPGTRPGQFVDARVRGAGPYDLIASPEEESEP